MPKNTNVQKGKADQSKKPKAATSQPKKAPAAKTKNATKGKKGKDKVAGKKQRREFSSYMFQFRRPSRRIGSGGVMPKTRALGRLMRWPKYIQLQRQRKVLLQRLKVPPALNLFNAPVGRIRGKFFWICFITNQHTKKKMKVKRGVNNKKHLFRHHILLKKCAPRNTAIANFKKNFLGGI
ncbi:60S ribosomal protein L7A (RPL7aB) [Reticulomyxa filosa]|uniref:60S ribosomal protein L7a n=1 Tax=Reticulomyxa filosa TaxID=46433 RepID=X6MQQ3_RETFI|nr:60S ribosomal protein L7A (RPL7aB) [Reticulomyxa filosa]|eukprot:ETO16333.1 60S ribosomal protein L7A (RPL7aB) [Reticulomyxa filosa]